MADAESLAAHLARTAPLELADFAVTERKVPLLAMIYTALAIGATEPGLVTERLAGHVGTDDQRRAFESYCALLGGNQAVQANMTGILRTICSVQPRYLRQNSLNAFIRHVETEDIQSTWRLALAAAPAEDVAGILPSVVAKLSAKAGNVESILSDLYQLNERTPSAALVEAYRTAVTAWMTQDMNAGLTHLKSLEPCETKDLLIMNAVHMLCQNGEEATAAQWLAQMGDSNLREEASQYLPKKR